LLFFTENFVFFRFFSFFSHFFRFVSVWTEIYFCLFKGHCDRPPNKARLEIIESQSNRQSIRFHWLTSRLRCLIHGKLGCGNIYYEQGKIQTIPE
jgi:hypothetical protein